MQLSCLKGIPKVNVIFSSKYLTYVLVGLKLVYRAHFYCNKALKFGGHNLRYTIMQVGQILFYTLFSYSGIGKGNKKSFI